MDGFGVVSELKVGKLTVASVTKELLPRVLFFQIHARDLFKAENRETA